MNQKPMFTLVVLTTLTLFLSACSTIPFFSKEGNSTDPSSVAANGTAHRSKKVKKIKSSLREKRPGSRSGESLQDSAAGVDTEGFTLNENEKIFMELSGVPLPKLSDGQLYKKAIEFYRRGDAVGLENIGNFLLRRFPLSIYGDNIHYLKGMMAFNQKKFGDSLTSFQKILDDYPKSNKAVSALYGKGIVFRKMNLDKVAVRMLAQVINEYPGTPESKKAKLELDSITQ